MPPAKLKTRKDFDSDRAWEAYCLKRKEDILSNVGKGTKLLSKIDGLKGIGGTTPIQDPLAEPKEKLPPLKTNTVLDEIFSYYGGIEVGSSVELYSEFAGGKTRIVQTLAVEAKGLVIYIDAEHTFRREGFCDIAEARGKNVEDVSKRLLLYKPMDWMEQEYITMNLPEYDKDGNYIDVGLVVVDSIVALWRASPDFFGRQNLTNRQQLIRAQVDRLKKYVQRHNAVLVYTNQVYKKPDASIMFPRPEQIIIASGGDTMAHLADYRILLLKKRGNIRVARLVDALDVPLGEVPFILGKAGIEDIPDPKERAKALERSDTYGEKWESGQVDSKPAGEKYEKLARERGLIEKEVAEEHDEVYTEPENVQ